MKAKCYALLPLLITVIYLAGCGSGSYTIRDEQINKDSLNKPTKVSGDTSANWVTIGPRKHVERTYRIRTAPSFTLQINANYNYGLAELSNPYTTVFEAEQLLGGENFGVRKGFGGFVVGKIPLEKQGNVRLTFTGGFNYFKNDNLSSRVSGSANVHYSVASLGAGIENSFTPTFKVKPYVAASLMANLLWGEAKDIVNPDGSVTNIKFKKTFRIGYIISSGVEFLLSNRVGLNMGVSLVDANRMLKSVKSSGDPNEFEIRDKKDTNSKNPLFMSGYKQFVFSSFYLGVNIYFGIKNKLYKL